MPSYSRYKKSFQQLGIVNFELIFIINNGITFTGFAGQLQQFASFKQKTNSKHIQWQFNYT